MLTDGLYTFGVALDELQDLCKDLERDLQLALLLYTQLETAGHSFGEQSPSGAWQCSFQWQGHSAPWLYLHSDWLETDFI